MLNNEMLILLRENSEIKTADAQMKLENLFEDLHWLVLVAGTFQFMELENGLYIYIVMMISYIL